MNTVAIGDEFEEICGQIIEKAIQTHELGISPMYSKVFKKKGYYSKDRESEIIFDISIEVWLPNSQRYTLLYLIECKKYGKSIPVNDVEEFHSKINQVAGVNVKGVFMTNNTFQSGAYTIAKNKGMMLMEVSSNITYNIILHKANRHSEKQLEVQFNNSVDALKSIFETNELKRKIDKSIIESGVHYVKNNLSSDMGPSLPKISTMEIEEITQTIISYYDSNILKNGWKVSLGDFLNFLNEVYSLKVVHCNMNEIDQSKREVISSISFLEKCIRVDHSIVGTHRYAFTIAHEIGHFFLHNRLQIDQGVYEKYEDSRYNFTLNKHILENERNWIEWQANQFATSLILPKDSILYRLFEFQKSIGLRGGHKIYVDDQECTQDDFHKVTSKLATFFQTSKTSIIYRLNALEMIDFNYRTKHISEIIEKYMIEDVF